MFQSLAGTTRTSLSSASRSRRIPARSSRSFWFTARSSSLPICLRLRSMKAMHCAAVIVSKFSENRSTLHVDIRTSYEGEFRMPVSSSPIMPKRIASAKQISVRYESRRGQGCDISARGLWRECHFYRLRIAPILDTRCRNTIFVIFPFELCKGDLSIRLFCSTGCGLFVTTTTRFSAPKGRN